MRNRLKTKIKVIKSRDGSYYKIKGDCFWFGRYIGLFRIGRINYSSLMGEWLFTPSVYVDALCKEDMYRIANAIDDIESKRCEDGY